jgi:hypothetical protein
VLVGNNNTVQIVANDDAKPLEQSESGKELGSNSPSTEDSDSLAGADPLTGSDTPFVGANNEAVNSDGNYEWDFNQEVGDLTSGGDLDALFEQSPWAPLKEVGITSFSQVFGDSPSEGSGNPFGGNPMGGGENASGGGGIGGGGGNPFGGGGGIGGGGNPFGGGDSAIM